MFLPGLYWYLTLIMLLEILRRDKVGLTENYYLLEKQLSQAMLNVFILNILRKPQSWFPLRRRQGLLLPLKDWEDALQLQISQTHYFSTQILLSQVSSFYTCFFLSVKWPGTVEHLIRDATLQPLQSGPELDYNNFPGCWRPYMLNCQYFSDIFTWWFTKLSNLSEVQRNGRLFR